MYSMRALTLPAAMCGAVRYWTVPRAVWMPLYLRLLFFFQTVLFAFLLFACLSQRLVDTALMPSYQEHFLADICLIVCTCGRQKHECFHRIVASVSTFWSRDGLETYPCLVSVSPLMKWRTSRSRANRSRCLGLVFKRLFAETIGMSA